MGTLQVAFVGTFSASLEGPVRTHLNTPCDVILADETGIVSQRSDVLARRARAFDMEVCAIRRKVT